MLLGVLLHRLLNLDGMRLKEIHSIKTRRKSLGVSTDLLDRKD